MKKVILLLVDSLMPGTLEDAFRHRTVPALQFLTERGRYWPDCVTVFPTMTASVDSSLLTGVYPDRHRVPGLIWYDPDRKTIVNYMNGWKCVKKLGIVSCIRNVLYDLNETHLSKEVTTIFEELDVRGKTSAAVNAMVHRGGKKHPVRLSPLADFLTQYRLRGEISGPEVLTLGALTKTEMAEGIPKRLMGAGQFYGITDSFAVHVVQTLIRSGRQPDFILAYLPDNDHKVHKQNPDHAETALIGVDRKIQQILNMFGSWDEALDRCVFIVTGDHGQSRIGNGESFQIDLDELLGNFRILQLGETVGHHDLVVANNERMAYVYPLADEHLGEAVKQLATDSRLDLIAWKERKGVRVREGGSGREIYFERGGRITDLYGSSWTVEGEWNVLDLRQAGGRLEYGDYPDGLARLYGALFSQPVPMIVATARPRYELKTRYYPTHPNGGCHGSLHKYDSFVPLIIAGTDHPVKEPPRLIDLKSFVVELFEP